MRPPAPRHAQTADTRALSCFCCHTSSSLSRSSFNWDILASICWSLISLPFSTALRKLSSRDSSSDLCSEWRSSSASACDTSFACSSLLITLLISVYQLMRSR
ncbi:hypothetical protein BpHYR1_012260 [Brachionus plicatilis]|uniref:Uncharacterized protein n=1 Tax=Brachionus plicatilis TaxID=10195 RepID=A0A3M7S9R9_BRAPC|nr:hypothetical protein BpHYR1_012260 [Brachionus plicatilis]